MIVIMSWYSDGSGEPEVNFHKVTHREDRGYFGIGPLIADVRETKHKECRAWDIDTQERVTLLYDSVRPKEEQ